MCGFFEVPCPLAQCPERLPRKEVPDHLSWRCQQRQASCDYCQATMPLAQLQVGVTSPPVQGNMAEQVTAVCTRIYNRK